MLFSRILLLCTGIASASRWLAPTEKVRGVNLGSLFVIEPWMAGNSWNLLGCDGTGDEWSCTQKLTQDVANSNFQQHWRTWITESDIKEIKQYGLNTIRIPVGFWIIDALVRQDEFYPRGALEFLDRLVGWAANAGLYVIIDLHGAPGSQTHGKEFTGHSVETPGFFTPHNFDRTYGFLEAITWRAHKKHEYRTVGVIEVLNEPTTDPRYQQEQRNMIDIFYPEALRRVRALESKLNVRSANQLKVQFMSSEWQNQDVKVKLPKNDPNLLYDSHKYYQWGRYYNDKTSLMQDVCQDRNRANRVIVGECSMTINSQSQDFSINLGTQDELEKQKAWYRSYWGAQAKIYERGSGWIFWSWKCEHDDWRWCYQNAVRNGVIPDNAAEAASFSIC